MTSHPTTVAAVARMVAHIPDEARVELLGDPIATMEELFAPLRFRAVDLGEAFASDECSCDGYYVTDLTPGVPWILFRADVVAARLLFTLLHELGHHLIRHVNPDLLDVVDQVAGPGGDPSVTEELLCHEFASEVLIPTSTLDAVIGAQRPEPRHVAMLHEASDASWEAAAVRVAQRLSVRGAVVLIRASGRIGFSVPSAALRAPWPADSVLDPEGLLARALDHSTQQGEDTFRWGLDGALRLTCVTERIHDHLAVAVLADERLSGQALLDRIRGLGIERPAIEPARAEEVREALETSVLPWIDQVPADVVVRVNKNAIREVLTCERRLVARHAAPPPNSPELVRGRLLDRLFVQRVHGVAVGPEPVGDALQASLADGDTSLQDEWNALSDGDQSEVREAVRSAADGLDERWPALPPNAFIRLQEPLRVDLAGGRVVLSGRVDLMVGAPSSTHVGTTIIDAKSGRWSYNDSADAGFYSLLETVRHGAPPFQAGTYYLRDGTLDLSVADLDWIDRALARTTDAIARLMRLAAGESPGVTPNGLCPWCPAIIWCAEGRRFVNRDDADNWRENDEIDDDEEADEDF